MLQRQPPAVGSGGSAPVWRRRLAGGVAWLALLSSSACGAAPPTPKFGVVTIGGATYRLPASVFEQLEPPQGLQDSLLLFLPVLAGPDDPTAEPVQVLLVPISGSDAQDRARKIQASVALNASIATSLALEDRSRPLTPAARPATDAPASLVPVAVNASNTLNDDVFARPPLEKTSEFIGCNRLGGVHGIKYPHCSQEFGGPGMTVKVTYPRVELSKWSLIRQAVLGYLETHRVGR